MWKQSVIRRLVSVLIAASLIAVMALGCEKGGDAKATASSAKVSASAAAGTATAVKQSAAAVSKTSAASTAASATIASGGTAEAAGDVQEIAGADGAAAEGSDPEVSIDKDVSEMIAKGLESVEFDTGSQLGTVINIDFGGKTIKHVNDQVTNMWGDDDTKRMEYRVLYRRLMEAEKKYNFKLEQELLTSGLAAKLISNTLAGVWMTDVVIFTASTAYPAWIQNKILLPLDEYIDYENPVVKANPFLYYGSLWKGHHYGYTPMYEYAFANCVFNREVLNREGIQDILDTVAINQWNWEAFLDVAKKCTKDTNGDGILDQWGVSAASNYEFCRQMLYSNGCTILVEENGIHNYNLNRTPSMRALQFASDLSYVHKVYKQHSSAQFQQGTCAFWLTDYWNNAALIKAGMSTGLAPLPMGPDVANYQNMAVATIYGISSMCKNPREVTQIIAEAMTLWDENLNPIPMYKDVMKVYGYDYLWSPINVARRITTEKEYNICYLPLYSYFRADQSGGYPGLSSAISSGVYTNILNGTMSVAQAVASVEGKVEDILAPYK